MPLAEHGCLVQWLERFPDKKEVNSSILLAPTLTSFLRYNIKQQKVLSKEPGLFCLLFTAVDSIQFGS